MDELLKDAHKEEKSIRKDKDKTKRQQLVMTTDVPTHENWKPNTKGKDGITFLSVNISSLTHWSRDSNKTERLKHVSEKYRIDLTRPQKV